MEPPAAIITEASTSEIHKNSHKKRKATQAHCRSRKKVKHNLVKEEVEEDKENPWKPESFVEVLHPIDFSSFDQKQISKSKIQEKVSSITLRNKTYCIYSSRNRHHFVCNRCERQKPNAK